MSRCRPPNEEPLVSESLRVDFIAELLDDMVSHQISFFEAIFRGDYELAKFHWENVRVIGREISRTFDELAKAADQEELVGPTPRVQVRPHGAA